MNRFLFTFCLSIFFVGLSAQGRIDTLDIDDYRIKTIKLSEKLEEISSLEFNKGFFWGNNDSGGEAEIYKINPDTGKIVQTVKITNAKNVDWEEISFGDKYVFIGDFGNNEGNRKDLAIYYFPISKLDSEEKTVSVEVEKIEFFYPEQKDFTPANMKTDFDGEAFFYYNGKLHLFTKEWVSLKTTHYTLDVKPGKQQAKKIETFKTNYAVTGAYVDENPISNTHGFYLVGYTPDGFALLSGFSLPKNKDDKLFDTKLNSFSLPLGFLPQVGQVEGVTIKKDKPNVICFSGEKFKFEIFNADQNISCIYSLAQ